MDIIEIIKTQPMDDSDIRFYLPNIEIIKYNDLKQFKNIDELLDKNIDIVILLIEFEKNTGHWVSLLKYDNIIEFFDAYGKEPLYWVKNNNYPQDERILKNILDKAHSKVIYNKIQYQDIKDETLATCGRFVLMRFLCLLRYKLNCDEFYRLMKYIKDETKMTYDEIVSNIITKF